ncbi:MAG TPA: VWA domain-containing protein, partial [Candidatus Acetothermia bacterium]|nr:VWA domain-containing protein [Candidatus Acetothermia bacterium]
MPIGSWISRLKEVVEMRTRILALAICVACMAAWSAGALENILFVFDASNSMNKPMGEITRLQAATDALSQLLTGLPDETRVGLVVFGHRESRH